MTTATTRVLLVEDDEDDYLLTRDVLARIPGGAYTLDWVNTCDAGLALVSEGRHDVYLIDYRLGADSGIDLLRTLTSAGCRAPIILLTGQGDHSVDSEAMQAGAADYLVKGEITSVILERALRHARDREHLLALHEALAQAEAEQVRLRASEQFSLAALDALPEHIAILDHTGAILAVNAAWRRYGSIYGVAYPNALIGQNYIHVCEHAAEAGDDSAGQAAQGIGAVLSGQATTFALEYPSHIPTEQRWFALKVAPYVESGPGHLVVAHHDISDRVLAQADMVRREESFRLLFRANPQPMWVYEVAKQRFLEVNEAAVLHYGYTHDEFLALRITDIVPAEDVGRTAAGPAEDPFAPVTGVEWRHRCKDGRMIDVAITAHALEFEGHAARLVVAVDITVRKHADEQVAHMAHHDALTGLPNRRLFNERLEQAVAALARQRATLILMLIDLNRFKEVNDTLGHQIGDALLSEVARRLREALRPTDMVARLGGDEFAVLLPDTDEQGALQVAQRLGVALDPPLHIGGHVLVVEMSIGIALARDHATDATTLLRFADLAMYKAKAAGTSFAVYQAEHDQRGPTQLSLAAELRQAIVAGHLCLYFQPIVTCASATVSRVEALVRWRHPVHGLLSSDRFVPLAEQMGLMTTLTLWVLERAIEQCGAWHRQGLALGVTVNVSMGMIEAPQFTDVVTALLRQYDLPARDLTFELTENRMMAQPQEVPRVLTALAAIGVGIAMDDFGAGFSSLSYLHQLPVDEIKIDRLFFLQLAAANNGAVVGCMLRLAEALGCRVVVEGVETQTQWDWLIELGCGAIQGYYVSKPLPAEAVGPWLLASCWAGTAMPTVALPPAVPRPAHLGRGTSSSERRIGGRLQRVRRTLESMADGIAQIAE